MNPVELLRRRLEEERCRPRAGVESFMALCPAHDSHHHGLRISTGADGRALVYCNSGCTTEAVVVSLGLSMRDLFPAGHYRGPTYRPLPLQQSEFKGNALAIVNVIYGLEATNEPWTLMIASVCPYCGSSGAWLRASNETLDADCPEGCDLFLYLHGLRASVKNGGVLRP